MARLFRKAPPARVGARRSVEIVRGTATFSIFYPRILFEYPNISKFFFGGFVEFQTLAREKRKKRFA
jgi:hypothetical protein